MTTTIEPATAGEVYTADGKPHPTNTRAALVKTAKKYAKHECWFGIEQEYTFFKDGRPYGFPVGGFPAPQGGYYCGVGADEERIQCPGTSALVRHGVPASRAA